MRNIKPLHIYIGLIGLLLLFINPITRPVIIWLLPLGSGWDDFVITVLVVFIGLWTWLGSWIMSFEFLKKWRKIK